jgi:hypothetical protein
MDIGFSPTVPQQISPKLKIDSSTDISGAIDYA